MRLPLEMEAKTPYRTDNAKKTTAVCGQPFPTLLVLSVTALCLSKNNLSYSLESNFVSPF